MRDEHHEQLAADIILIVSRKAGIDPISITMNTRLLHDLRLYGDDAEEILSEIARSYAIDFSDFAFEHYFFPESFALWLFPGSLGRRAMNRKCPITIQELVEAAASKRWAPSEKGSE